MWKKRGAEMEITRYRDQLYGPGRQNEMPLLEEEATNMVEETVLEPQW